MIFLYNNSRSRKNKSCEETCKVYIVIRGYMTIVHLNDSLIKSRGGCTDITKISLKRNTKKKKKLIINTDNKLTKPIDNAAYHIPESRDNNITVMY